MTHSMTDRKWNRRPISLLAVAALALAGCAAPQPYPVANYPAETVYAAPAPNTTYDYRRRDSERLYEANVTSVQAVAGTPERRCWIEQQQAPAQRSGANLPGAIVGGVLGGILGHQIGGGSGRDAATGVGVIAGAAIGANVGRDRNGQPYAQNVQRCDGPVGQYRPDYWEVTYNFRGQYHRVQTNAHPGSTITVNEMGEPRY